MAMADVPLGSGAWLVPWGQGSLLCPRSCTCSAQMCCSCDGGRHKGPVTRGVKSATRGAVVISTRLQTPHWPFLHRPPTLQGLAAVRCSQTASLPPGVPIEELQPSRGVPVCGTCGL